MRRVASPLVTLLLLATAPTCLALDYKVRNGDTLSELASRFGVSVRAIQRANGLSTSRIRVGDVLKIPGNDAQPAGRSGSAGTSGGRSGGTTNVSTAPDRPSTPARSPRAVHPPMQASAAEVEVLARIVKGECWYDTPFEGKVAVAATVLNRVRASGFPRTIAGVAHEPLQFSCYNANFRRRLYYGPIPDDAYRAARAALAGEDPTGGATHYYNPYLVRPAWARRLRPTVRIGTSRRDTHVFYR